VDGAAAADAKDSKLNSSDSFGFYTAFGFGGSRGEPFKSIAFVKVCTAFSIIGSTSWRIPNLRSKSATAGIILLKLYIFENTFTRGCVSSSLFNILFVNAF